MGEGHIYLMCAPAGDEVQNMMTQRANVLSRVPGTDSEPHLVHCRLNRCRSIFVDWVWSNSTSD